MQNKWDKLFFYRRRIKIITTDKRTRFWGQGSYAEKNKAT